MGIFLSILSPVLAVSGMGILFGLGLGYAGKIFEVKTDETVEKIRGVLPGANCGGCGLAGCDAFAQAVASGAAAISGCPVGGEAVMDSISEILGVEKSVYIRKTAFVKCGGGASKSEYRYEYMGLRDCTAASALAGGGAKACKYGCLGSGSCVTACKFGAITLTDGIAVVDSEKCTQCAACVAVCPRNLIELIPYGSTIKTACNSKDTGKTVRSVCSVGCIGCKLCVKACQHGAVSVTDNIAQIDYEKCTGCGDCAAKCPTKAIV